MTSRRTWIERGAEAFAVSLGREMQDLPFDRTCPTEIDAFRELTALAIEKGEPFDSVQHLI